MKNNLFHIFSKKKLNLHSNLSNPCFCGSRQFNNQFASFFFNAENFLGVFNTNKRTIFKKEKKMNLASKYLKILSVTFECGCHKVSELSRKLHRGFRDISVLTQSLKKFFWFLQIMILYVEVTFGCFKVSYREGYDYF